VSGQQRPLGWRERPDRTMDQLACAQGLLPALEAGLSIGESLKLRVGKLGSNTWGYPFVALASQQFAVYAGMVLEHIDTAYIGSGAKALQDSLNLMLPAACVQKALGGEAYCLKDSIAAVQRNLSSLPRHVAGMSFAAN
jgi:hypothetical protein